MTQTSMPLSIGPARSPTVRRELRGTGGLVETLFDRRRLVWQMAKREVRDRYAGQALGTLWAVAHPILLMGLYLFLFTFVFPSRVPFGGGQGSAVTYILAGLIPWLTVADAMSRGTGAIVNEAGLVKQVVFPVEILPIKSVLASGLPQGIATFVLLLYMAAVDRHVPLLAAMLPLLFLLQLMVMAGLVYVLSSVGAYVRDLREIVQVFVSAGVFVAPILYSEESIERTVPGFASLLSLNPFSHLVWCYQDALYYGRFVHPVSWLLLLLLSPAVLFLGYRVFRKLKLMFGEVL
ncbi:ABC-2 type transporter [Nitrospira japonica]|uniref:Transport permease protein n=2 Tax=Nitrospira japonica TaxID=1325564 RepID=A0A1W1IBG8_9BACT|nr:ABC-2 type transporter [Nitrospira japonica]